MTSDENGAANAAALYGRMSTADLLRLKAAHELDQAAATTPSSIAFGGGRLALIAAELRKRE